jgi:hypothetical protein
MFRFALVLTLTLAVFAQNQNCDQNGALIASVFFQNACIPAWLLRRNPMKTARVPLDCSKLALTVAFRGCGLTQAYKTVVNSLVNAWVNIQRTSVAAVVNTRSVWRVRSAHKV